jgi:hypothetical protein
MISDEVDRSTRIESRWPVICAVLGVLFVLFQTPERVHVLPPFFALFIAVGLLLPPLAVWLSHGKSHFQKLERLSMLITATLAESATLSIVFFLAVEIVQAPTTFGGQQLLTTSIGAWSTNILAFSIVYWHLDRGGPEARLNKPGIKPDWLFPQTGVPEEAPVNWRPTYVDYLFLSFSTATAFSTTDVMPMSSRAKMLMMVESAVSLTTLAVVASRAIGLLGS